MKRDFNVYLNDAARMYLFKVMNYVTENVEDIEDYDGYEIMSSDGNKINHINYENYKTDNCERNPIYGDYDDLYVFNIGRNKSAIDIYNILVKCLEKDK